MEYGVITMTGYYNAAVKTNVKIHVSGFNYCTIFITLLIQISLESVMKFTIL